MSELQPDLAKALVQFQSSVPTIEKNRTAKIPTKSGGSYSYKYADLADIWSAIRKPLADVKLAVTQFLIGGSDGYTVLRTTVWHESGQHIESDLDIPTQDKTAQEVGSQITYYKRYALGAALGISTEDDDDGAAGNSAPTAQPQASKSKPASEKQLGLIRTLSKRIGLGDEAVEARIALIRTSADASEAIDKLNARIEGGE